MTRRELIIIIIFIVIVETLTRSPLQTCSFWRIATFVAFSGVHCGVFVLHSGNNLFPKFLEETRGWYYCRNHCCCHLIAHSLTSIAEVARRRFFVMAAKAVFWQSFIRCVVSHFVRPVHASTALYYARKSSFQIDVPAFYQTQKWWVLPPFLTFIFSEHRIFIVNHQFEQVS